MTAAQRKRRLAAMHDRFLADIAREGFAMLSVEDGPDGFQYTLGLALADLPELLFLGGRATAVLSQLARMQLDTGQPFVAGQELQPEGWQMPVRFVAAPDSFRDEYTVQAGQVCEREDYCVLQVVAPDLENRFPGDPGCAEPYCHQLDWRRRGLH